MAWSFDLTSVHLGIVSPGHSVLGHSVSGQSVAGACRLGANCLSTLISSSWLLLGFMVIYVRM